MGKTIDYRLLSGFFIRGDMRGAMEYMKSFPETEFLYRQYVDLFENEHYITYGLPELQEKILLAYQRYYRDVFYLRRDEAAAAETLHNTLAGLLMVDNAGEEFLADRVCCAFHNIGYHVRCGKTNGYYGPYIWKETVSREYTVELPDGQSTYRVNLLSGFIMRSWMDYLTFGERGTGGWTEPDGTICCVEEAWDPESERFTVSLLKHEAQHAEDMKRWPGITAMELEYRAKLVELIYTSEPNLLTRLLNEKNGSCAEDSHAQAALRLEKDLGDCSALMPEEMRSKAKALFRKSTEEMIRRYGKMPEYNG